MKRKIIENNMKERGMGVNEDSKDSKEKRILKGLEGTINDPDSISNRLHAKIKILNKERSALINRRDLSEEEQDRLIEELDTEIADLNRKSKKATLGSIKALKQIHRD